MAVSSRGFRVMASITQVTLVDPEAGAAEYAEARLRELEQRWSRFIDTSDVTLINQNPEAWVPVGRDTIRLIQAMQLASDATGGSFDPTFLHQLLSTGYTSSIDDPSRITLVVDVPSKDFTVHDVAIDLAASRVFVPTGLSLDRVVSARVSQPTWWSPNCWKLERGARLSASAVTSLRLEPRRPRRDGS